MYKRSLFSEKIMTPEGVIFILDDSNPLTQEYYDWKDLGNVAEELNYFPGEFEAEQKRLSIMYETGRGMSRALFGQELYSKIIATIRYDEEFEDISLNDFESIQEDLDIMSNWMNKGQFKKALSVFQFQQASFSQIFMDRYYEWIEYELTDYISKSYGSLSFSREENEDIGGGGIKNPKP